MAIDMPETPRPAAGARRRILLALAGAALARRATAARETIDVRVAEVADGFEIAVALVVAVPQRTAWDVLTDFDNMAGIVSNLSSSRVLSRSGRRLVVAQSGSETQGLLRFDFESVREIELTPPVSMHSRLLHGSMRRLSGWTRLSAAPAGTLIESLGDLSPGSWTPPLVAAPFIERATRRQYEEMSAEMLRRR